MLAAQQAPRAFPDLAEDKFGRKDPQAAKEEGQNEQLSKGEEQALLQPQQEAAPTSTKRSCSANATPTKEGSSEEAGGMEAPSATSSTAHVRARAQRARMHSPGGGPATGQLLCSSAAFAGGGPPQPSAAFAGGLMQRFNAGMPACNSFTASGTPGPSMLEHMRAHEYPNFMRHHMQQGMSQQAAHARWGEYERFRMAGAQVSGS